MKKRLFIVVIIQQNVVTANVYVKTGILQRLITVTHKARERVLRDPTDSRVLVTVRVTGILETSVTVIMAGLVRIVASLWYRSIVHHRQLINVAVTGCVTTVWNVRAILGFRAPVALTPYPRFVFWIALTRHCMTVVSLALVATTVKETRCARVLITGRETIVKYFPKCRIKHTTTVGAEGIQTVVLATGYVITKR